MVIECPSCSTRFSVDAEQLAGIENPRFHCSRCDHLFELHQNIAQDSGTSLNGESFSSAASLSASAGSQVREPASSSRATPASRTTVSHTTPALDPSKRRPMFV